MSCERNGSQISEASDPVPERFGSGKLVPLKTALETTSRDVAINVYVTLVPVKQASAALK